MLTEQQIEELSQEQVEAILWADSYLWPDAQETFEEILVESPDVVVPLWREDPWLAFRVTHIVQKDREAKALAA